MTADDVIKRSESSIQSGVKPQVDEMTSPVQDGEQSNMQKDLGHKAWV